MRKIFLVTDYVCNSTCISCAKRINECGFLSLEQIIEKINGIQPSTADSLEISGGEPTLRKDFFDICGYIKSHFDTQLVLLSNGRRFKDPTFARKVRDIGVDRVMSTFYSPYEVVHDLVTQIQGSFDDTVQGIKNLEAIEMQIAVKTIILKQNYQQLSDFVRFAYDTFPTAGVSIHGLIMRGRASDNKERLVVKHNEVKPHLERALDVAIERQKNLGVFLVPTCVIDPSYWSYLSVNWKQMAKEMIYISPEETVYGNLDVSQPAYCDGCLMSDHCSWSWESAWREYIHLFGTEELNRLSINQEVIKQ